MDDVFKDKRFSNLASNPRFKNLPYKDRKVKIDKRFQSMFTDKRFQVKYEVDERGRKINELQTDNYKKYYDLTDSSDESNTESENSGSEAMQKSLSKPSSSKTDHSDPLVSSTSINEKDFAKKDGSDIESDKGSLQEDKSKAHQSDDIEEDFDKKSIPDRMKTQEKLKEAKKEVNKYIDEIHKVKLNEKIREKLADITVDYARGIGTLLSGSDSSSDEPSSEESEEETIEHPWGEFDKEAETTEETTPRLAVCNMDWDRVTAKDLMVLFHSFLPSEGNIESLTIYPSEFGLERMAEEELKGPKELVENKELFDGASDEEIEEDSAYQREKLREYQLKRLKYYYAVIVCDSKETAGTLYSECDGLEYESSATKLDLRFVADDVTFDQKPHDVCTTLPDLKKYKPRLFINTALQQGKVDLTWDETDPNRVDFTRKILLGEDIDETEVKAYLASSTSEDEGPSESKAEAESDEEGKTDQDRIMKYRALISNLQEEEDKKKGDMEMEITWGPDSTSKDDRDLIASQSEEESDDLISDSEEKNKNLKNRTKALRNKEVDSEEERKNAELELLLADDNPEEAGRQHFNLKAIQKEEKDGKKKKKWRKNLKKKNYQEEDTFKIDTKDNRFSALYTSHHFNIDPADPHFRKTKAMNELITEKQKRRKLEYA